MKPDSKQQHPELQSFKSMALWLLAYKLFRDYLELLRFGQTPELEKFFEVWSGIHLRGEGVVSQVWKCSMCKLVARSKKNNGS